MIDLARGESAAHAVRMRNNSANDKPSAPSDPTWSRARRVIRPQSVAQMEPTWSIEFVPLGPHSTWKCARAVNRRPRSIFCDRPGVPRCVPEFYCRLIEPTRSRLQQQSDGAFSPDSKFLYSLDRNGIIQVFRINEATALEFIQEFSGKDGCL